MGSPGGPMQGREAEYSATQRGVNVVGLGLFVALTIHAIVDLVTLGRELPGAAWLALLAIAVAAPAADFTSGLVHWAADNWGSADWPIVGGFVGPFRHHHVDPEAMTRHGFLRRFGDNVIAALPTFWFASLADGSVAWRLFVGTFWLAVAYWVLATAQFHVWAHSPAPPRPVRWLQRRRLILSPEHHAVHHRAPHARHYCITTGWCDPLLERLRFFATVEGVIRWLTGVAPHHRNVASQGPSREPSPLDETDMRSKSI